jgi:SEC-C motif-containing protein
MRARFTAHCLRDYAFLVTSTHPDRRENVTEEAISQWASHVGWKFLDVHNAWPGNTDDEGNVSFTAHYAVRGIPQELREDAIFSKVDGEWKYVDGHMHKQQPHEREQPKIGRNEPCPCGSGKKYKKCCQGTE